MLSDAEIKEIEAAIESGDYAFLGFDYELTQKLLATVKELTKSLEVCRKDKEDYCADLEYFHKKYDEQREDIEKLCSALDHMQCCQPCGIGPWEDCDGGKEALEILNKSRRW